MKLLADLIDSRVASSKSLLLRYHRVFKVLRLQSTVTETVLARSSLSEGARWVSLPPYKQVAVTAQDESSLMETGTYKDLDAAYVAGVALNAGLEKAVVSSGGNLGYALSRYGQHVGLQSFFFHPSSTLYKLDAQNFAWSGVRLISVKLPEPDVKKLATTFARTYCIPEVPDIRWRLAASAVRCMFILESQSQRRVDWIAQTMCAGYGPAGIYNCFSELEREGYVRRSDAPRFFGFQQEANSPMVRAWRAGDREIGERHICSDPASYLEPVLYNTNPQRNYTRLFDLMRHYGGNMASISADDYARYAKRVEDWLGESGLEFARDDKGDILEKTGLLTCIGIMKAIDGGLIRAGEEVVCLLTGGLKARAMQKVTPHATVDDSRSIEDSVALLGALFELEPPRHRRMTDRLFR